MMSQSYCTVKCKTHSEESVKFYCSVCDQLACNLCKTSHHIPHMTSAGDSKEKVADLEGKLICLTEKVESVRFSPGSSASSNEPLKKDMDELLIGTGEKRTHSQASLTGSNKTEENYSTNKEVLKSLSSGHGGGGDLQDSDADICYLIKEDSKSEFDSTCKSEIRSKICLIKHEIDEMKLTINAKPEINLADLFVTIKTTENEMKELENEIERETTGLVRDASVTKTPEVKRSITPVQSLNVRLSEEESPCTITAMCQLTEAKVIAIDLNNMLAKLINVKEDRIVSATKFTDFPGAITRMSNICAALTLPHTKTIQLLEVSPDDQLVQTKTIDIGLVCNGIFYSEPNFYMTCDTGILSMDANKKVSHIFKASPENQFTLYSPGAIALDIKSMSIYVADECSIKKFNFEGELQQSSDYMGDVIWDIAQDRTGTLYAVAGNGFVDSNYINQLSSDLQIIHELDRDISAHSLFYCDKEDKLYMGTNEKIQVYQVE